jgi:DNA-directed RNA polymerase specialized sigma24 family protein
MEYTAQVSLARVLNKLDIYQGRSRFLSWVYKIAVRIALNEWRRLRWRDVPLGVAENEASNDRPLSLFGLSNRSPLSVAKLDDLRPHIQPIPRRRAERSRAEGPVRDLFPGNAN